MLSPELLPARRVRPPIFAAVALVAPAVTAFICAIALSDAPRDAARARVVVAAAVASADVIAPPSDFRDANAWPHGMVIVPPATHDRIALGVPAPVLSALFAPLAQALLAPGPGLL